MKRAQRTRVVLALGLALASLVPTAAQQTALTASHVRSAATELNPLVELLALKPGMTFADVGAGFGAWTMAFARWIGPSGRVFSTEIGTAQLTALRASVEREALTNVTVVQGGTDSTNLPQACCDAILLRDVYHHFAKPQAMIASLAAALKPGGRLAIIDFPPRGDHGVPAETVARDVGTVLTHVRTIPNWSPASEPGGLYLVLFQK